jgi:hypothetical protein
VAALEDCSTNRRTLLPCSYLIAQKYLEALQQIASDADKLVFMPYEASGVMASPGDLRELLQTARPPAK